MKRKAPSIESVVPREILERAKKSLHSDRTSTRQRCKVCGGECAPTSSEELCWVCRRLKISAWRDSDQQPSAQE